MLVSLSDHEDSTVDNVYTSGRRILGVETDSNLKQIGKGGGLRTVAIHEDDDLRRVTSWARPQLIHLTKHMW